MQDGQPRIDQEIWQGCRSAGYLSSLSAVQHARLALSEAGILVETGRTRPTTDGTPSREWVLATDSTERADVQQIELPLTNQVIHVHSNKGGPAETHDVYEGEAKMSQQQQDAYKMLVGDGKARVTVSRELSEADYGNGGKVFVSVTLACDQSQQVINQAVNLAHQVAEGAAFHYHGVMRSQLEQRGMLKPR